MNYFTKSIKHLVFQVVLIYFLFSLITLAQDSAAPSAAAQQRIKEVIQLIGSGDRKRAGAFIKQNFTASALEKKSIEQYVNWISQLHDQTRGLNLHSVRETKPDVLVALVQTKLTGRWMNLTAELKSQPASLVESLNWGYGSAPPSVQQPAKSRSEKEIVRELSIFMQKLAEADVFSGTLLLAKDGKVLFKQAYGLANKDFGIPNRVDTKLNLASLNKMFTAVAIAQLVEQGKLSFDDPLSRHLPGFLSKVDQEKVLIKHLLTHTSGLGDLFNERWYASARNRFRTVDDYLQFMDDKDKVLAFEPGSRRQYSNTGYMLLGKIIEKITGQSYFEHLRENVYKPAGMVNTDAYQLDLINKNLAIGYDKEYTDAGIIFRNNLYLHTMRGGPAGGGFSTIEDLLRFAVSLRAGKLVDTRYVQMMTTPKPELKSPYYGYGFGVIPEDGIVAHSGGAEGIGAHLEINSNGYIFAVLTNYGDAMAPVIFKIRELVKNGKSQR